MKIISTILGILILMVAAPPGQPTIVWTVERAQKYCFEQRQQNGHAECVLPAGVVVKIPKS